MKATKLVIGACLLIAIVAAGAPSASASPLDCQPLEGQNPNGMYPECVAEETTHCTLVEEGTDKIVCFLP